MKMLRKLVEKIGLKNKVVIKPIYVEKSDAELLLGKVAMVTGGSGGIGNAIGKKLSEAGADVILVGRNEEKLIAYAKQYSCRYKVVDVCNIKEMDTAVNEIFKKTPIDILVNAAGTHGSDKFGEVSEKCFDDVLCANVKALYFLSQSVSNLMIDYKIKGHILNVSSASSLKPSWTPYEISKRAVNGITEGFAHKLIKYGIVVNGIAPGPTLTKMIREDENLAWPWNPSGRLSTPEEIAALALFMVGPQGDSIVGDTFFITGGSGTIDKEK